MPSLDLSSLPSESSVPSGDIPVEVGANVNPKMLPTSVLLAATAADAASKVSAAKANLATTSIGGTYAAMSAAATLVHDIRFGSAATGGTANITNLAALIAHGATYHQQPRPPGQFPYVTHSGIYEYRKFDDGSAGTNYVFASDGMEMRPTSDHDLSATMVTQLASGATITNLVSEPMADFGLSSTSGLWVGRVVAFAYAGFGRVEAFDAGNVTIRMLASGWSGNIRIATNGLAIWTTATALAVPAGASAGATSFALAGAPPAAVANGMQVNTVSSFGVPERTQMGGSHITVSGSTINVSAPGLQLAVAAGGYVVFLPRFWTGQYVSPFEIDEPGIGNAWLIELDCVAPDNGSGVMPETQYMDTTAAYTAAGGANIPMPSWASFWLYEAHDLAQILNDDANAEIDGMEVWGGVFHGPARMSSAMHSLNLFAKDSAGADEWLSGAEGYPTYIRKNSDWQGHLVKGGPSGTQIVGVHMQKTSAVSSTFTRQILWERDRVSIYHDGELLTRWRGHWGSRRGGRVIVNASLGGLQFAGSNLNYPTGAASLTRSRLIAKALRVKAL